MQSSIWQIDHMHQHLELVDPEQDQHINPHMYQHPKLVGQGQNQYISLKQTNVLKKNPPKQNPMKATLPLEPKVIVVNPVDQPEEQVSLHPPNQPDQLPDIPPHQLDQVPNNPPNQQPKPPTDQPNQPPNQPNQPNPPNTPPINYQTFQQMHPIQWQTHLRHQN